MRVLPEAVLREGTAPYGGRVRILPPEVARRIAAGEVIERPASAVKELVENALDAGACRISIEVERGGTSLIRVQDDGEGMSPEDAERALLSHATSKIERPEDLSCITSLGFRGEALHSMASVSSLSLTTSRCGGRGWRVEAFCGEVHRSAPAAHPPGTTVEVRDLFLNLPVRRGFLGSPRAEASAVVSVVSSLALGWPGVGFSLRSDGRGALALPPAADLRERVAQLYGLGLAGSLVPLDDEVVGGLVSPLHVSFPTRRYLHVAVNGRVVEPDSFAPAVFRAYADLLPKGRHPAAFLRLELGPGEVDVNVHPAKSAVRLRGGRYVYPLVVGAIRGALSLERRERGAGRGEDGPADLQLLGQFVGRMIVAQRGEELLVLDQHGAHERILYERLQRDLRRDPTPLREPVPVHLPEGLAAEVWGFEGELEALGFRFETFGTDVVKLTSVPEGTADAAEAFLAAIETLAGGEDLAKALACRGSTKFGERLQPDQMARLLKEWASCEFGDVCPHGRPIVKRINLAELLREFRR